MVEKTSSSLAGVAQSRQQAAEEKRLKEACHDFEAILLSQVFKSMRDNPLAEPGDSAREMYQGMMDQSLASNISRGGRTGLAEVLYRQLSSLLKAKNPET